LRSVAGGATVGLSPRRALDVFFELIALRFLLDQARAVTELGLPLTAPLSANAVLAFDLALELTALGLDLHLAWTTPEVFSHLPSPPTLAVAWSHVVVGEGGSLGQENRCDKKSEEYA